MILESFLLKFGLYYTAEYAGIVEMGQQMLFLI